MDGQAFRCRVPRGLVTATCNFRTKRRLPSLCLTLQVIVVLVVLLSGCAKASARGGRATKDRRGAPFESSETAASATRTVPSSLEKTSDHHNHQRLRPGTSHGHSQQHKQQQQQRQQRQRHQQQQQQKNYKQQQEEQEQMPSPTRPKVFFVTYGSGKYASSMERLVQEAKDTGEFDVVHGFTRKDIDQDFARANAETLSQERGGGFWLWKPYFVRRVMQFPSQASSSVGERQARAAAGFETFAPFLSERFFPWSSKGHAIMCLRPLASKWR